MRTFFRAAAVISALSVVHVKIGILNKANISIFNFLLFVNNIFEQSPILEIEIVNQVSFVTLDSSNSVLHLEMNLKLHCLVRVVLTLVVTSIFQPHHPQSQLPDSRQGVVVNLTNLILLAFLIVLILKGGLLQRILFNGNI